MLVKLKKKIITIQEARKLLGAVANELSDSQVISLINELDALARILLEHHNILIVK